MVSASVTHGLLRPCHAIRLAPYQITSALQNINSKILPKLYKDQVKERNPNQVKGVVSYLRSKTHIEDKNYLQNGHCIEKHLQSFFD